MRDTTEATWKQPAHTAGLRVVARAVLRLTLPHTTEYCLRLTLLIQRAAHQTDAAEPPTLAGAARVDVRRPAAGAHSLLFARLLCFGRNGT